MSGYIGTAPVPQASQTRDVFTATASQTTFATSGYTPSFLDVYVNGSHLKNGTDYTASNGSDVVMASGLTVGDYVEVVAFNTFTTSDTVSASSGGVFSGEVGIGTGSDSLTRELTVKKNDQCDVAIVAATNQSAQLLFGDTDADNRGIIQYDNGSDFMAFTVGGSERMRIVGDDLQIGTTSNSYSASATSGLITNGSRLTLNSETGNIYKVFLNDNEASGSTGDIVGFGKNTTTVGSITVTTSATQYNTSSDYRLKTDVQPMSGATDRLKQLKPVNFAWIADGTRVDGFIAHEAQAVVPEAVSGVKDDVDADGDAKMQGIDQAKIVPLLTAALQEAITEIETLKTKVAALEAG